MGVRNAKLLSIIRWLQDVPPCLPFSKIRNRSSRHSGIFSNRSMALASSNSDSDCSNFIVGQFGKMRLLSILNSRWIPSNPMVVSTGKSPLVDTIAEIVGRSAKKQMIRIHARRIIAVMAYQFTFWIADMNFIRKPMREYIFADSPSFSQSSNMSQPVAFSICAAGPDPAAVRRITIDAFPESNRIFICNHAISLPWA